VLYVDPRQPPINPPKAAATVNRNRQRDGGGPLRRIEADTPQVGIDAELCVRDGSPLTALLRCAEEPKVDAIVIGDDCSIRGEPTPAHLR
jgi:hypothetical protein